MKDGFRNSSQHMTTHPNHSSIIVLLAQRLRLRASEVSLWLGTCPHRQGDNMEPSANGDIFLKKEVGHTALRETQLRGRHCPVSSSSEVMEGGTWCSGPPSLGLSSHT